MKPTKSKRKETNKKATALNNKDISQAVVKEGSLGKVINEKPIQGIYQQIREVLIQARSRAWQAVNTEMVLCYWQIGRLIVEEEQREKHELFMERD